MSLAVQLDFFKPIPTTTDLINARINDVYDRQENLRRGLFSRHSKLYKLIESQDTKIEKLEKELKELKKFLNFNKSSSVVFLDEIKP